MILLEGLLGTASALSLEAGGPILPSDPITIGIRSGSESFQVIQGSSGEPVAGLALVCTPSQGSPQTVITDRSGRIDRTLLAAGTWQLALQLPEEGTLSFARPDEMQIPVNGVFPAEVTPIGVTRLILGPPKRAERPAPTGAIEQERERQQRERARLAVLAESVARMRREIDACPAVVNEPELESVRVVLEQAGAVVEDQDWGVAADLEAFIEDARTGLDTAGARVGCAWER